MKKLLLLIFTVQVLLCFAQEQSSLSVDVNYFKGYIPLHSNSILHLISGHPEGFIIGLNQKTSGEEPWQALYNYPDYGLSISYQNLKNDALGENFALYGHYNFYFFKRHLMVRIGQGLAWTTNPFDQLANPKNTAFGSKILSSTLAMVNYKKNRLFGPFGIQAGLSFIHYSNANVKAPNTSVNTIALNFGLVFDAGHDKRARFIANQREHVSERLKVNFVLRSGINQSDLVGSKQYPFFVFSAYVDKRLNKLSALQLGADLFVSEFLRELIQYLSAAYENNLTENGTDFKRIGIFAGHELFINKLSLVSQLGYYVYYPFEFESRTYVRIGLKRYFGQRIFGAITLKSHGFRAEAVEFGIGIRL